MQAFIFVLHYIQKKFKKLIMEFKWLPGSVVIDCSETVSPILIVLIKIESSSSGGNIWRLVLNLEKKFLKAYMKVLPNENSVGLCLMFYVWATILAVDNFFRENVISERYTN